MKKKNTVSLATAKKWIAEWRDLESSYNKYNRLKAFNIPLVDLQQVVKEKGVESVRAYIGVAKFENKDTKPPEIIYEEKLLIVGVDKNNKDMITVFDPSELGDGEGDDIYDMTQPCPNLCDPDSPLNG